MEPDRSADPFRRGLADDGTRLDTPAPDAPGSAYKPCGVSLLLLLILLLLSSILLACATHGESAQGGSLSSRDATEAGVSRGDAEEAEEADPFAAIDRLAEALKRNAAIARAAEASAVPFGRGEGALHVLRLMRRAIDEEIAWADTDHPYFQIQDERYAKLALGNPDNLYLVARVEDDAIYRITGQLGSTADFNLQLYQGYPGVQRPFTAHGALGIDRLVTDSAGRFEVIVGGPERPERARSGQVVRNA